MCNVMHFVLLSEKLQNKETETPSPVTNPILVIAVVAIGVTVGTVLLAYVWKQRLARKGSAESPATENDRQSTDGSNLVNNTLPHDGR